MGKKISNFEGIRYFINLTRLNCEANDLIHLDLSSLSRLRYLDCSNNKLTSLNVDGLEKIETLNCYNNKFVALNIGDLYNLTYFNCEKNQIASLELKNFSNLQFLSCGNNQIQNLDVSANQKLNNLQCSQNILKHLSVSKLNNLIALDCSLNQIASLDVSGLNKLLYLVCSSNGLMYLNLKASKLNQTLNFENNPNLEYICCDEGRITEIKNMSITNGQNCEVSSECSLSNTWDESSAINIYPNPVKDILHLQTDENWSKAEIYDISGKIIRSITLDSYSIDVSGLESGTYFIRLKDGDKVGVVKFVKI